MYSHDCFIWVALICSRDVLRRLFFLLPHVTCSHESRAPLMLARDIVCLFLSRLFKTIIITTIKINLIIRAAFIPLDPACFSHWILWPNSISLNVSLCSVVLLGGYLSSVSKIWTIGDVYHRQSHTLPVLGPILRDLSTSDSPECGTWSHSEFCIFEPLMGSSHNPLQLRIYSAFSESGPFSVCIPEGADGV